MSAFALQTRGSRRGDLPEGRGGYGCERLKGSGGRLLGARFFLGAVWVNRRRRGVRA
jgi:hypothetical protein